MGIDVTAGKAEKSTPGLQGHYVGFKSLPPLWPLIKEIMKKGIQANPLLIIDSDYLCWKAMLGMPGLSWEGKDTAVIFDFLRQVLGLAERFKPSKIVFAWDSKRSYRKDIFPDYKANRKKDFNEQDLEIGKPQFQELHGFVLPTLGFRNSFKQTGIEADDIMSKIVLDYWPTIHPRIVLITADKDMYQMLRKEGKWNNFEWVIMYNPATKKKYTGEEFQSDYGISPLAWMEVKTLAGCSGDNVPGIRGIGEKTAVSYLLGHLVKGKKFEVIKEFERKEEFDLTRSLVQLPFHSTQNFKLASDELLLANFETICYTYGFHSFLKKEYFLRWKTLFLEIMKWV